MTDAQETPGEKKDTKKGETEDTFSRAGMQMTSMRDINHILYFFSRMSKAKAWYLKGRADEMPKRVDCVTKDSRPFLKLREDDLLAPVRHSGSSTEGPPTTSQGS